MEKNKLKPCPFCGSEAELIDDTDICLDVGIGCEKCNFELVQETPERAIKAWNTRTKGWG